MCQAGDAKRPQLYRCRGLSDLDGRADLYALGLILAECVSGSRVVAREDTMGAIYAHARPEPHAFSPEVERSLLYPLIVRATQKEREDRYPDALAMRADLPDVAEDGGVERASGVEPFPAPSVPMVHVVAGPSTPLESAPFAVERRTKEPAPNADTPAAGAASLVGASRPRSWAGVVLFGLVGAVAATVVVLSSATDTPSVAEAPEPVAPAGDSIAQERRALLVERGRQELAAGRAARALAYLVGSLQAGEDTAPVRLMIAEATRPLSSAVARIEVPAGLYRVAWSPDGTRFITTEADGGARLFTPDGVELARIQSDGARLLTPRFSRDGRLVAAASRDGRLFVWDAVGGVELWSARVAAVDGAVIYFAFTPSGDRIVAHGGETTSVRDAETGAALLTIPNVEGAEIGAVAVSPDGNTIAIGQADGTAVLRDIGDGHETGRVPQGGLVAFSEDGRRLFTLDPGEALTAWDLTSGAVAWRQNGPQTGPSDDLEISTDGTRLLTRAEDNTLRVWDTREGNLLATLGPVDYSSLAFFSHDGRQVASGRSGSHTVWDVATGRASTSSRPPLARRKRREPRMDSI